MFIFLIQLCALVGLSWTQGPLTKYQIPQKQGCVDDGSSRSQPNWIYHAPARSVPLPPVDPAIKRGFLGLFHRDLNTNHTHGSPFDPTSPESSQPPPIDPSIIAEINALCSRSSFFYSFAPRHMRAIMLVQEQFMAQPTAARVLQLAKNELYRHEINNRVWYYALLGTLLMRPDLNGYYAAWALDATPDLFIPATILKAATVGSSHPPPDPPANQCVTSKNRNGRFINENELLEEPLETEVPEPSFINHYVHYLLRQKRSSNITSQFSRVQKKKTKGHKKSKRVKRQVQTTYYLPRVPIPLVYNANDYYDESRSIRTPPQRVTSTSYYSSPIRISNTNYLSSGRQQTSRPRFFNNAVSSGRYPTSRPRASTSSSNNRRPVSTSNNNNLLPSGSQRRERKCYLFRGTQGTTSAAENTLWYFREDMMLTQHHWYWHQYYPQMSARVPDRRGEVFYFAHHDIIARYNAERISNGLPRVVSLDLRKDGNIGVGYYSDLIDAQSGREWTSRPANTVLSDINHLNDPDFRLNVTMNEISTLYRTLITHIAEGFLLANRSSRQGQPPSVFRLDIRNQEGLSHLGNTLEASESLSLHPNFYHPFGVHVLGHLAVALASDPDFNGQCPTGVMADLTVTFRDPAFYRVHSLVDDIFDDYKKTLVPYQLYDGDWPLVWEGIQISSLELVPSRGKSNRVKTFWSTRKFPLEEGIDGSIHDGDVEADVCHVHLTHEPFMFKLTVDVNNCARTLSNRGTVRIFLGPRRDENGRRFTMSETRRLMFQLDAFPVELSLGRNTITRNARDSSLTKPWSRNLVEMLKDPDNGGQPEYCGCGWPDHLYLPKGTPKGMEFDLFAMITNYDLDQVQDTQEDLRIPEPCISSYIHCGVPYRRYPDARPMGYPFDRLQYSVIENGKTIRPVNSLEEYVTHVPNMKSSVVVIQHVDQLVG